MKKIVTLTNLTDTYILFVQNNTGKISDTSLYLTSDNTQHYRLISRLSDIKRNI